MGTEKQTETKLLARLREFLEYLEITKNRAAATLRNYRFYLERFFRVMGLNRPSDITGETVKRYRLLLNRWGDRTGTPLSKSTQNYHLIAVRAFLKYLAKEDVPSLAAEKVELAKQPDRQIDFLEGADLDSLFRAPLTTKSPRLVQLRDAAILETLFSTGLRISELVALTFDRVSTKRDEVSVRGKGGKVRVVFFSRSARAAIEEYRKLRTDNAPFVFIRHDRASRQSPTEEGQPLTARSVQRSISRYARLAGITKHVTPHTLRHSFATDLLVNGADVRSVQELLGHSSITTTQIYTHVTNRQLRDIHHAFHARRRKRTE